MSRRGFAFFIRPYGMDCLIRFYLPDDDPEDLTADYPLTTAKLVTNNLYICLLEVFKQSLNQLTNKAKLYRNQRYNDRGVPRSLYQRTVINPDSTMVTTLSSADYFDALDRLPDPTYGETSSERLASIVAMANSLTAEDRALVIYEPRVQLRFRTLQYGYDAPPVATAILGAYLSTLSLEIPIDYDLFLHDVEPPTQVHRYSDPHNNASITSFRLNNSPRNQALNQRIRHTMTTHADIISRVNRINPQYRSPALMRQIQLLESQHEQFLRCIHDVEVLRRSDHTRVHRHYSRHSPLGLRDDRWLRNNNRMNHSMSRRPQPRRPGAQQPHLVPISRRPRNPQRPRILQPYQQPQRRPTHRPTVHVPANRRILPSDRALSTSSNQVQLPYVPDIVQTWPMYHLELIIAVITYILTTI